ncbi:nitrilase [Sclerotinia borealis F-4128]|uniref:Nitrilase n=1 Tax=Sclerotinia borealis (strain F-4128) TaxID=1432307 RepID=W9C3H0_SCLBF|nr:nitrilase [Sclerotinia borealis F-4128]
MAKKIIAAAVHAAPVFMNKKASIEKVLRLIREAKEQEVDFVVFPETFVPGYPYFIQTYAPLQYSGALAQYADQSVVIGRTGGDLLPIMSLCASLNIAVSIGISERVEDGYTLFNSQAFIDTDGTLLGVHRKIQPTHAERTVWAQGSGHTLRVWPSTVGRIGGLACWENTMNIARQALIEQRQEIHAAAWPALSTVSGFEPVADVQIEALMKNHAFTAQVWVVCASNYVDEGTLDWMEKNLGAQDLVKKGGGWSAVIHPFCSVLAGPHTGAEEKLVKAEINFGDLGGVKVWIDASGHYKRPGVLKLEVDKSPEWPDDEIMAKGAPAPLTI